MPNCQTKISTARRLLKKPDLTEFEMTVGNASRDSRCECFKLQPAKCPLISPCCMCAYF